MADDEAIFIEVRYKNGRIIRAEGAHAKEVWDWICSAETMAWVHGAKFHGNPMKEIKPMTDSNTDRREG